MVEFGAPTKFSEADLEALLRRNFEAHWIEGLLADPTSRSVFFAGMFAVILRVQDAVDRLFYESAFILSASGAKRATTTVRLTRPSGSMVTLTTERYVDDRGAIWRPTAPFVVAASGGTQTVDVPITSERAGEWLNSPTPLTFYVVDALPDENLVPIAGVDPAIGGAAASLDEHGAERGTPRNPNELDADYAHRMRFVEDAVSPRAIADAVLWMLDSRDATRFVADMIQRNGLRAVLEPFEDSAQSFLRNFYRTATPAFGDACAGGGTYTGPDLVGMTAADDAAGHVLRSVEESRAWMDVVIPTPAGTDDENDDAIKSLADVLDRIRGGAVGVRIITGEPVLFLVHPPLGGLVQEGTWLDQNGSAADEDLVAALEKFDADDSYAKSLMGEGAGSTLDAGDLLFEIAAADAPPEPDAATRVEVHARVRRRAAGSSDPDPELQFLLKTGTAGAAERVGSSYTIDHEDWRWYRAIFEVEPISGDPLDPGDTSGAAIRFGVANVAAAGATRELDVSELYLVIVNDYA